MTNGKRKDNKGPKFFTPSKDKENVSASASKDDTNDEMVSISLKELESLIDTKLSEQRLDYENKIKDLEIRLDIQMTATRDAMATIVENRLKAIDGLNKDVTDLKQSVGIAHKETSEIQEKLVTMNGGTREIKKTIEALGNRAADHEDQSRRQTSNFTTLRNKHMDRKTV